MILLPPTFKFYISKGRKGFILQVEEVRSWKDELLKQRRTTMDRKMQRAEEKRQVQLRQKVRKAHEEETKVSCGSSPVTFM